MKKFSLFAVGALIAITGLTGCQSTNISARSARISPGIETTLKADIIVGNDISGNVKETVILGLFGIGGPTKFADGACQSNGSGVLSDILPSPLIGLKSAAAYKAIGGKAGDIIVAPKYVIEIEDYFLWKNYDVTVQGKSGKIKNIK
jgi:hypothetical protein